MDENQFKELEQFIQGKLASLPDRKAPANLAEGVFKQIARQQSKWWWQRPFTYWPKPAQIFLHCTLAASFLLFVYLGSMMVAAISANATSITGQLADICREIGGYFGTMGKVCWAVMSRASWDVVAILVALLSVAYFGCVGLGVALYRVAFRNLQTT